MPVLRLLGNALLSFLSKFSCGYWSIFDPTNGYTALHVSILPLLPLDKIADRYFFETDLLFRLHVARAVVRDIPHAAHYGTEKSGLKVRRVVLPFLVGHLRNLVKRIFYEYFLRDFHLGSLQALIGPPLLLFGVLYGWNHWHLGLATGTAATPGTVMVAALSILVGLQLILAALSYDMNHVPTLPLHPMLKREAASDPAVPPGAA